MFDVFGGGQLEAETAAPSVGAWLPFFGGGEAGSPGAPDAGGGGGGLDRFPSITAPRPRVDGHGGGGAKGKHKRHHHADPPPVVAPAPAVPADTKSSPEQLAAAEATRKQLGKRLKKLHDLTRAQKRSILRRTKGLSGDALVTEMGALQGALAGKNGERALATYAQIEDLVAKHPEAKDRISPEMMSMLVTGVGTSRTTSDRGQAGILGARQARDSARALIDMSADEYTSTQSLLDQAGKDASGKVVDGADPAAEQALILKAVAARRDDFKHTALGDAEDAASAVLGFETPNAKANSDLEQFAADVRGMKREELIQSTTLIDIDDKSTSSYDPEFPRYPDEMPDNDGLYQRFTMSCGPTTAQMVLGENDPVYALQQRQRQFEDADPNSEIAREQKRVLEDNGGVAVDRVGADALKDATYMAGALHETGALSEDQQADIETILSGQQLEGEDAKKANAALDAMRAKNEGHPTDLELQRIQADAGKSEQGIGLEPALDTIAEGSTHLDYENKDMGSRPRSRNLRHVDKLLKDGQQVPIRIEGAGNDGHFMMISDVRGAGRAQTYLVSDPWSGATRWVTQADLKSGAFTTEVFNVGEAKVTDFYADKRQRI